MQRVKIPNGKINNKYLLDFYLKDFKHISPKMLEVHRGKGSKGIQRDEKFHKVLFKAWMGEIFRGIKLLFCQGSLHGVK